MQNIASYIDHTLLKKDAKENDIKKLCEEAIRYGFCGVCIYPKYLPFAKTLLKNKNVKLVTVIDFPEGKSMPSKKAKDTKKAINIGADEIDMVIDVMSLKRKDYQKVFDGIFQVVREANGKCVKVIIETALLEDDEKKIACALAKAANADYVKTSTGFAGGGATIEDVELIKKIIGNDMKVKASGGIKSYYIAYKMIKKGADRIGTSSSIKIVQEEKLQKKQRKNKNDNKK